MTTMMRRALARWGGVHHGVGLASSHNPSSTSSPLRTLAVGLHGRRGRRRRGRHGHRRIGRRAAPPVAWRAATRADTVPRVAASASVAGCLRRRRLRLRGRQLLCGRRRRRVWLPRCGRLRRRWTFATAWTAATVWTACYGVDGGCCVDGGDGVAVATAWTACDGVDGCPGVDVCDGVDGGCVDGGDGVDGCHGVDVCDGVDGGCVDGCHGVDGCDGVDGCHGVDVCDGVDGGCVDGGDGVDGCHGVDGGDGVDGGCVDGCHDVDGGDGVDGSHGVDVCYGVDGCHGVDGLLLRGRRLRGRRRWRRRLLRRARMRWRRRRPWRVRWLRGRWLCGRRRWRSSYPASSLEMVGLHRGCSAELEWRVLHPRGMARGHQRRPGARVAASASVPLRPSRGAPRHWTAPTPPPASRWLACTGAVALSSSGGFCTPVAWRAATRAATVPALQPRPRSPCAQVAEHLDTGQRPPRLQPRGGWLAQGLWR